MSTNHENICPPRTPMHVRLIAILCFWLMPFIVSTVCLSIYGLTGPKDPNYPAIFGIIIWTGVLAILTIINALGFGLVLILSPPIAYDSRRRFWILAGTAGTFSLVGAWTPDWVLTIQPALDSIAPALWILCLPASAGIISLTMIRLGFLTGFLHRPGDNKGGGEYNVL